MTEKDLPRQAALPALRACVLAAGTALMSGATLAWAEVPASKDGKTVEFNPAFLPGGSAMNVDLSRYARGNPVMPGSYEADIWLNGEWQARRRVRFAAEDAQNDAMPCLTSSTLTSLGVALAAHAEGGDDRCLAVGDRVPGATARFDVSEQRLDIEVPQAALARRRPGLVPPSARDAGIPSGLLAWHLNVHRGTTGNRSRTSRFFAHEAGVNAGHWRARGAGSWSASRYTRQHLYVERQVDAWKAQWRIGELMAGDGMFAPVRMRGMTLASDARMKDDASLGYKPTVRGTARTHARVRVSQAGVLVKELSVPPGPFVIDDLQGLGRGGDLHVVVYEEDGERRSFRLPFFAMPELLGEGQSLSAMSAGRAPLARGRDANLIQAVWRRGYARDTTLYTGLRRWGDRSAALLGGAVDTPVGAFAVDFTGSRFSSRPPRDRTGRGRTWRLRHGRRWRDRTSVWVSAVRERGVAIDEERLDVALHRELSADGGMLTASASYRRTRHAVRPQRSGSAHSYALAWTRGWRSVALDLSLRHDIDDAGLRVGVSMPMGAVSSPPSFAVVGLGDRHNGGRVHVGLAGAAGPDRELGYGAFVEQGARNDRRMGLSASRLSSGGESSLAIDRSGTAHGESFSTGGALLFHGDGVTRAQRLGAAMALVHAPGAAGARLPSAVGVRLDRRGYGAVPYLAPFRWNAVEVDPTGLSLDVSFASTRRRVAPTAGALVRVPFETDVGRTSLLVVRLADGSPPAFGADVLDEDGRSVGVVGQAGSIFVRNVVPDAALTIRWGPRPADRCVIRPEGGATAAHGLVRLAGVCR